MPQEQEFCDLCQLVFCFVFWKDFFWFLWIAWTPSNHVQVMFGASEIFFGVNPFLVSASITTLSSWVNRVLFGIIECSLLTLGACTETFFAVNNVVRLHLAWGLYCANSYMNGYIEISPLFATDIKVITENTNVATSHYVLLYGLLWLAVQPICGRIGPLLQEKLQSLGGGCHEETPPIVLR